MSSLTLAALALAVQAVLLPGTSLPELSGDYLTKEEAQLPRDCQGKIALLALGFSYDSRFAVEEWTKAFRKHFQGREDVTFYEIPMIGGLGRLARPFIDSGMRKGTPKELHRNVITVYGGTGKWKDLVGFKGDKDAYLLLVDETGQIRWMHNGLFDADVFQILTAEAAKLADGADNVTASEQETASGTRQLLTTPT